MTQFLNLGGELIDLYADYEYARQDSSPDARSRREDLYLLSKTTKTVGQISKQAQDEMGTWEAVGGTVGLAVGVAYGYATLPVVVLDGPLPFLDMAWAYSTARFTYRAIETGRSVGKKFD